MLAVSSLSRFGKYMEAKSAKIKIKTGADALAKALTKATGPIRIAKSDITNAEKSMAILKPSNPFTFIAIDLKVCMNSFRTEGTRSTANATKLVSLSHKTPLQKSVTLKTCFAETYAIPTRKPW